MSSRQKKAMEPETARRMMELIGLGTDETHAAELASDVRALREGIDAMDEIDLEWVEPALTFATAPRT